MMSGIFILVVLLVRIIAPSHACIFKAESLQSKTKDSLSHRHFSKTISECECGTNFGNGTPSWNLYIHVRRSEGKKSMEVLCTGTFITSNLVATSHECVHRLGKKIHVYDAWGDVKKSDPGVLAKEDIVISTSAIPTEGDKFPVEEMIFNAAFIISSSLKKEPDNDILLLKVKADFTTDPKLRPICIPDENTKLNFVGQVGHYYALDVDPNLDSIETVGADGIIFTKKMCDDENYNTSGAAEISGQLCIRWSNQLGAEPPHIQGGPLIVKSIHDSRAILVGLACNVTSKLTGTATDYAYFVNIPSMVKYIKYQADKHGSKWCKEPKLELGKPAVAKDGPWPWEQKDFQDSFNNRKESLDCVCGVPNKGGGGRIAGGIEATPYEFGWMALIKLFIYGKKDGRFSYCGGSIINNRMILTAAHCLVPEYKIDDHRVKPPGYRYAIQPENVVLTLSVHNRNDDEKAIKKEVEAVLLHPRYVPGRKSGYYDFDIGLLVLKEPLEFPPTSQNGIRPICLPKLGESVKIGEMATVAGWGLTNPDRDSSKAEKLQQVELPIINLNECKKVARAKVTNNFICAGSLNKFKDAARGDSGGPLKIKRGDQYTEMGIVSWGEEVTARDGTTKTAALYTDLTNPVILPFVDYFGKRAKVEWCKSAH